MTNALFLKVQDGRLHFCVDISGDASSQGNYLSWPITNEMMGSVISHWQATQRRPSLPRERNAGGGIERFPDFWKPYLRKEGKVAAMTAWRAQRCDDIADVIIADVERRAGTEAWTTQGGKYIPMPASYLNQRRWEDESGQQTEGQWF